MVKQCMSHLNFIYTVMKLAPNYAFCPSESGRFHARNSIPVVHILVENTYVR